MQNYYQSKHTILPKVNPPPKILFRQYVNIKSKLKNIN